MKRNTNYKTGNKTVVGRFMTFVSLAAAVSVVTAAINVAAVGGKSFDIEVNDGVAGFGSNVVISGGSAGEDVVVALTKPDSKRIEIFANLNSNGGAIVDIDDYHVRDAGDYGVEVKYEDGAYRSLGKFEVFPASISDEESEIKINRHLSEIEEGEDVEVTVVLKDSYGNALEDHQVVLISSRSSDVIVPVDSNGVTDSEGEVSFMVRSQEPGISSFTAYDLFENISLNERAEVVFYKESVNSVGIGGDLFSLVPTAKAQSAAISPVAEFEFVDLADEVKVNESISFGLKAIDDDKDISENYSGKVHFSVEGASAEDVILPNDYQFIADDLGEHVFSLGLLFKSPGEYKIIATDLDDAEIKGEASIKVTGQAVDADSLVDDEVELSSPRAGTYNQGVQTVSGKSAAGIALKVFDNDKEIGSVDADDEGNFTFKTPQLEDGKHSLKVVAIDDDGNVIAESAAVAIEVDTEAPEVDEVKFEPKGPVGPESLVKVTVITDANLAQAAIVIGEDFSTLTEDLVNPGYYHGSFVTPKEIGTYKVDLILVDTLGNEAQLKDQAELIVAESNPINGVGNIGSVSGIKSFSSDGRVTLQYDEVEGAKFYRVYYGLRADSLNEKVDTFEGLTKWYVPELTNGTEYFFAVTAVDENGNESAERSEIVSGIPFEVNETGLAAGSEVDSDLFGFDEEAGAEVSAGLDEVKAAAGEKPRLGETGPEMVWLLFASMIAAWFYRRREKEVKKG